MIIFFLPIFLIIGLLRTLPNAYLERVWIQNFTPTLVKYVKRNLSIVDCKRKTELLLRLKNKNIKHRLQGLSTLRSTMAEMID